MGFNEYKRTFQVVLKNALSSLLLQDFEIEQKKFLKMFNNQLNVLEEYGIIFLFIFVLPFENRILNLFSDMEFLTFIKFIKFLAIQTTYYPFMMQNRTL